MLKLVDLIHLSGVNLGNYKIHCATNNKRGSWRPLDAYFAGTFEAGQASQSQKNFECDHVLSLINLGDGRRWLFVGIYRVMGVRDRRVGEWSGFQYSLELVPGLEHLVGRAIVDFPKTFRASYLVGSTHEDQMIVSSIREEEMSIADFPGFSSVRLSFEMLRSIVRQKNPSWQAAMASIAGIYIVVDISTGKQYVGSAYGGIGIWQRWSMYAKSGHGGNKELRALLLEKGKEYSDNFQFSLLEVCDINANPNYVISRESYWKDVLLTREFGLNHN